MVRNSYARGTHLARVANAQYGAFTAGQFVEAGFTRDQLRYRVGTGEIVAIDQRVYRHVGTPPSRRQRLMAACLAGPAVASHRSAGMLWEFPEMSDDIVEVTALRHRRRHSSEVIWHESYHLTDRDVTEVDGIRVTRPIRTFLDLGAVLSADQLETVLNEGVRRRLVSVPTVWQRLEEYGPLRRGAAVVQAVLERGVPNRRTPESVLETRFLQVIRSAGLPEPVPQFPVRFHDGASVRLDFAYPSRRIGIELDGATYHWGERAERRDRMRDHKLGAMRWRMIHFDWDDVTRRPEYVVETVDAYLMRT